MKDADAFNIFAASASESVREIWPEEITWTTSHLENDRKAGGGRTVTSVAAEFESTKVSFRALGKAQTTRRKEADGSQQASLLSNSLQNGARRRGLLWPDAFTNRAYSPAALNAASR
ncbi:hypothetical protein TNCV_1401251 [Trichonephila clavipes]|nr:hypothetical protein TNCV_1401251 [Trichonephila clavipes]